MGAHGRTYDNHRKGEYYLGQRFSKHKLKQFEEGNVGDRFVLPSKEPPKPKKRKPPHFNAELVKGLRDNELRACYRATFHEDPGQMGKDKMMAAFLDKKAPRARVPTSYAPDYDSVHGT